MKQKRVGEVVLSVMSVASWGCLKGKDKGGERRVTRSAEARVLRFNEVWYAGLAGRRG